MDNQLGAQAAACAAAHIKNLNELFKFSFTRLCGLDKPNHQSILASERMLIEQMESLKAKATYPLLKEYVEKLLIAAKNFEALALLTYRASRDLVEKPSKKEIKAKLKEQQLLELEYLQVGQLLNEEQNKSSS